LTVAHVGVGRIYEHNYFPVKSSDGAVVGVSCAIEDITERVAVELKNESLVLELREALTRIDTPGGLLPICASCKTIRDKQQVWHELEIYIQEHSKADFTHGLCPECLKDLYPEA